jgi:hypothetical protein
MGIGKSGGRISDRNFCMALSKDPLITCLLLHSGFLMVVFTFLTMMQLLNLNLYIMKRSLVLKKIIMGCAGFMFLLSASDIHAQSLKRSCISCYGSAVISDQQLILQTAGQIYSTRSSDQEKTIVFQGFQQPISYSFSEKYFYQNLKFNITPNPAQNSFTLMCPESIYNPYVVITDLAGKNLYTKNIPDVSGHVFNCESWKNGIYYITIQDKNGRSQTNRFLILK